MIDARLDREIEIGARARPRYKTDIVTTDGGHEVRNARWRYPLFDFEFELEPGDPDDAGDDYDESVVKLEQFVKLFHVVGGSHGTFRFRHWRDYAGVGEAIGTGDGVTTEFQLYKLYRRGLITRRRKILLPIDGTVTVYLNGVAQGVTLDPEGGTVTFAVAPALAVAITADFEFDVPVRFADDELEMIALTDVLDRPGTIVLKEVRSL